jgi:hypothetical protein
VPEGLGHAQAVAVAPALRQRQATGRQHDSPGLDLSPGCPHHEPRSHRLDGLDPLPRAQHHTPARGLVQQRLEDDAGAVRVGKELAVLLLVQLDPDLAEERHRLRHPESPQDAADEMRRRPAEVGLGHGGIRQVAARAPAHEDLRPRPGGSVEEHDRPRRSPPCGEDGAGEPGRPRPDDRDHAQTSLEDENVTHAEATRS